MTESILDPSTWAGTRWIWAPEHLRHDNLHLLCRRTFTLENAPEHATLWMTANTSYELYLNGRCAGRGPNRSFPSRQVVDRLDVTDLLHQGKNVLAVHAYHHGATHQGMLPVHRGPGGLLGRLEVDLPGGRSEVISTDGAWRVLPAPHYLPGGGFVTHHRKDYKALIDLRREPTGWMEVDYDESAWPPAAELGGVPCPPWETLIENPLPVMTREEVAPVNVHSHHSGPAYGFCPQDVPDPAAMIEDDQRVTVIEPLEDDFDVQVLVDFGRPVVGRFHLEVDEATGGEEVCISYGDSLDLTRIDRVTLRGGAQHVRPYPRRFGRYVMLTFRGLRGPVSIRRVWFELVTYPVSGRGSFRCSDELLNRIWDVGAWTLRMNMHDHYEDCPFREQLLYCGDLRLSALFTYYAFGDTALARESILKLARARRSDGRIPNCGPVPDDDANIIPEFPALWLVSVVDYLHHSGDTELVKHVWPAVVQLLDWYAQYDDDSGLMKQIPTDRRADFVDNLAGIPLDGPVLVVQCFYHMALAAAAELAEVVSEDPSPYLERADRLARAVDALFWDEDLGGYLSCLSGRGQGKSRMTPDLETDESMPLSCISNGMALHAGLVPPGKVDRVLEVLTTPGVASPFRSGYMGFYVVEALFRHGRAAQALARLREYWGGMIDRGATTFWEVFDESTPEGRLPERMWSLCHEFCAGPLYSLPVHVLGVQVDGRLGDHVTISPGVFDLTWAEGTVPTPRGDVGVSWRRGDAGWTMELTQPAGLPVTVVLSEVAGTTLHVDGTEVDFGEDIVLEGPSMTTEHRIEIVRDE